MATAIGDRRGWPDRLLTIADVASLSDRLPSGDVRWELWDGRLIVRGPHTDLHAAVVPNLVLALHQHSAREVVVYRRNEPGVILTEADTLTAGDVLPGAAVPVRALMAS